MWEKHFETTQSFTSSNGIGKFSIAASAVHIILTNQIVDKLFLFFGFSKHNFTTQSNVLFLKMRLFFYKQNRIQIEKLNV